MFAVLIVIGAASISLLPVALELGCELTRNADGSAAILWFLYVYTSALTLFVLLTRLSQRQSRLRHLCPW